MGNKKQLSFEQELIDSFVDDEVQNWRFDPIIFEDREAS